MCVVISGYRYYSAELGRWLSRDPIGEEGGKNLYLFVNNLVINSYDFIGLQGFNSYLDFGNSLKSSNPGKKIPMPGKIDWKPIEDTIYDINEALYPEPEKSLAEDISQRLNQEGMSFEEMKVHMENAWSSNWEIGFFAVGGVEVKSNSGTCCENGKRYEYHTIDLCPGFGIGAGGDASSCPGCTGPGASVENGSVGVQTWKGCPKLYDWKIQKEMELGVIIGREVSFAGGNRGFEAKIAGKIGMVFSAEYSVMFCRTIYLEKKEIGK